MSIKTDFNTTVDELHRQIIAQRAEVNTLKKQLHAANKAAILTKHAVSL